jgi:hypothetical protein
MNTARRRTFDDRDDAPQQRSVSEIDGNFKPCRYCGEATAWETLSRLGARCGRCYEQFLRLGYSGHTPPPEIRPATWVQGAAREVREHMAANGRPRNVFAALSDRMRGQRAEREAVRDLSEDEVNAMLAGGEA